MQVDSKKLLARLGLGRFSASTKEDSDPPPDLGAPLLQSRSGEGMEKLATEDAAGGSSHSSPSSGLSGASGEPSKPAEIDLERGRVPSSTTAAALEGMGAGGGAGAGGAITSSAKSTPLLPTLANLRRSSSKHADPDKAGGDDAASDSDDDDNEEIEPSTYNQAIMLTYRLKGIRHSHRLQALVLCAVTVVMQAFLPAALLNQWRGEEGFAEHGLFPRNLPAKDEATFWLQVTMLLVGTYCLFSCFKDFVQELLPMWVCVATDISIVQRLFLKEEQRLFLKEGGQQPAPGTRAPRSAYTSWLRLLFQLFICCTEIACITLVLLVSFALTLRSEDVKDAILSGAGTLFILEVDATLGVTGPAFTKYLQKVRKYQHGLQDAGDDPDAPHIWFRRRRRRESYVQHLWKSFKQPFGSSTQVARLLERASSSGRYKAVYSVFTYAVSLLLTGLLHVVLISCGVAWLVMYAYFASRLAIWDWVDKVPIPHGTG